MKRIYLFTFALIFSFASKAQNTDDLSKRVEELGHDLISFSRSGKYDRSNYPKDLAYMGIKTFWKLFEISDPIDNINIVAHESKDFDNTADYILDLGTYLGLRIKHDSLANNFHVLGYFGSLSKMDSNYRDTLRQIDNKLALAGNIIPNKGLEGLEVNKTSKKEILNAFPKHFYNRVGVYFEFDEADILKGLYLSSFQFKTDKGMRPQYDIKKSIIYHYGEPLSIDREINLNGRKLAGLHVLNYEGISFICLGENLVMIKVM